MAAQAGVAVAQDAAAEAHLILVEQFVVVARITAVPVVEGVAVRAAAGRLSAVPAAAVVPVAAAAVATVLR